MQNALLGVITWNPNPYLFEIGTFRLAWYGLLFAVAFAIGYYLTRSLLRRDGLSEGQIDGLLLCMVLGIILGARLGHVLLYQWDYYQDHPIEILQVWRGGLASHGAAVGIVVGVWVWRLIVGRLSVLQTLDRLTPAISLGGAFVRFGNLINQEIVGKLSSVPWAFRFLDPPASADSLPRHPVQLYESLAYLLCFGLIMWFLRRGALRHEGRLTAVFLIGIFVARFALEFFKAPFEEETGIWGLNPGHLYSIPIILIGMWLAFRSIRQTNNR